MTGTAIPDFEHLVVTNDGRRGTLTINRPSSLNSLSNEVMSEIIDAARWFDHQPDLRVVVVAGEGRAFCAGFDVTSFGHDGSFSPTDRGADVNGANPTEPLTTVTR